MIEIVNEDVVDCPRCGPGQYRFGTHLCALHRRPICSGCYRCTKNEE